MHDHTAYWFSLQLPREMHLPILRLLQGTSHGLDAIHCGYNYPNLDQRGNPHFAFTLGKLKWLIIIMACFIWAEILENTCLKFWLKSSLLAMCFAENRTEVKIKLKF